MTAAASSWLLSYIVGFLILLCLKAWPFSLAEVSYNLTNEDCPKIADVNLATAEKLCRFSDSGVEKVDRNVQGLKKITEESLVNSYFSGLAKVRSSELACVDRQILDLLNNESQLEPFIEKYAHKIVLLGAEKRKMDLYRDSITKDPNAREEYKKSRINSEAIIGSLQFAETQAMSGTIQSVINQTDLFSDPPPWFFEQIKTSLRKALPEVLAEIRRNKMRMEKAVQTRGESLRRIEKESLAQNPELIESFRHSIDIPTHELKSISCRVDAEYGQGAKDRDSAFAATALLGFPARGILVKAGQMALRSSLVGAALIGRISSTTASIMKPLAFASGGTLIVQQIERSCLSESPTLTANQCKVDALAKTRDEDCALITILGATMARHASPAILRSFNVLKNAIYTSPFPKQGATSQVLEKGVEAVRKGSAEIPAVPWTNSPAIILTPQERAAQATRRIASLKEEARKLSRREQFSVSNGQVYSRLGSKYVGEENGTAEVWHGLNYKVRYLNKAERAKYKVTIKNGRVYDSEGNLFDTSNAQSYLGSNGRAIFSVDKNGDIYISNYQMIGEFHHSTLVGGEPVAMAGEISILNGRVKVLTSESGHYMPSKGMLKMFVEKLKRKGIKMDDVEVKHWDEI